jgi:hypothetical protein
VLVLLVCCCCVLAVYCCLLTPPTTHLGAWSEVSGREQCRDNNTSKAKRDTDVFDVLVLVFVEELERVTALLTCSLHLPFFMLHAFFLLPSQLLFFLSF